MCIFFAPWRQWVVPPMMSVADGQPTVTETLIPPTKNMTQCACHWRTTQSVWFVLLLPSASPLTSHSALGAILGRFCMQCGQGMAFYSKLTEW